MSEDNGQLQSLFERILRLHEERDGLSGDIREVYAEAKSAGFDKTAMGALVTEHRKRAKNPSRFSELEEMTNLYRETLAKAASHTHAREAE